MRLPDRVARVDVPVGYDGTLRTVRMMVDAIREGYLHPRLRWRARTLFAGLEPFDYDGEIGAVWQHVVNNVRYQKDPLGVEHITTPAELDAEIDEGLAAEDCESMVVYAASLLAAAGIPSQIEIIGWDPSKPDRYRHVALVVVHPTTGREISFDPVAAQRYRGRFALGDTTWRTGLPRKRFTLDGDEVTMREYFNDQGDGSSSLMGCAFGDLGVTAADVLGPITGALKSVSPYLGPYGALTGGAAALTEGIYGAATGQQLNPQPMPGTTTGAGGARPGLTARQKELRDLLAAGRAGGGRAVRPSVAADLVQPPDDGSYARVRNLPPYGPAQPSSGLLPLAIGALALKALF